MRLLEALGDTCTRAAASLGAFDVIGTGPTDLALVQVKTNAWPDEVELERLRAFRCPPNARRLIHRWRDGARMPDVREL